MLDNDPAMQRFLASVERRAFRMAEIATGSTEDALDIVQDAMFGLVRRYASKPASEWGALFFRILESRIRDWYRRTRVRNRWRAWLHDWRGRDEPNDGEDPMATLADPAGRDPADEVVQADAMAALEGALRKLPLRQQQAFLLRAWQGMSVAETAAAMKCSDGSVKTHYSRAVQMLRKVLEDDRS